MSSISYVHEYSTAMMFAEETFEYVNLLYPDDPALESVSSKSDNIVTSISDKVNSTYSSIVAAYNTGKYDEALAKCDEMKRVLDEADQALDQLPPESKALKAVKFVAHAVGLILSIYVLFNRPKVANYISNVLHTIGIPAKYKAAIPILSSAGSYVAGAKAASTVGRQISGAIVKALNADADGAAIKEANKDNPNVKNAQWVNAKKQIKMLYGVVDNLKAEIEHTKNEEAASA